MTSIVLLAFSLNAVSQGSFVSEKPGFIGINTNTPTSFLTVEGSESASISGDFRTFLKIHNKSNSSSSFTGLEIMSGSPSYKTVLQHVASTYLFPGLDEYADFGQLYSRGAGLILRSGSAEFPSGVIKFMTGITGAGGSLERMRIDMNGNVGIGTKTPKDPLVVASSEIPYSEISIGVNGIPENGSLRRAGHHIASERDIVFNVDKPHIDNLSIGGRAYSFRTLGSSSTYTNVKSIMVMNTNGNVGIGSFDMSGRNAIQPKAKLHISEGDIYLDDPSRGIIMTSPNGNCWKVTINDTGTLQNTQIVCPN